MTPEQERHERDLTHMQQIFIEGLVVLAKRNLDLFHENMELKEQIKGLKGLKELYK